MALHLICKFDCLPAAMLAFNTVDFEVALVNRIELSVNVGLLEAPHYNRNIEPRVYRKEQYLKLFRGVRLRVSSSRKFIRVFTIPD